MKRTLLVGLIALSGCAAHDTEPSQKVALNTTVSSRNINDISRDVQQWHDIKNPSCKYVRVIGAEIIKNEQKNTVEHWTIEGCQKKQFTYRVLILSYQGGISDMVSNVEETSVAPQNP
jgi:hypothetical protein